MTSQYELISENNLGPARSRPLFSSFNFSTPQKQQFQHLQADFFQFPAHSSQSQQFISSHQSLGGSQSSLKTISFEPTSLSKRFTIDFSGKIKVSQSQLAEMKYLQQQLEATRKTIKQLPILRIRIKQLEQQIRRWKLKSSHSQKSVRSRTPQKERSSAGSEGLQERIRLLTKQNQKLKSSIKKFGGIIKEQQQLQIECDQLRIQLQSYRKQFSRLKEKNHDFMSTVEVVKI